MVRRIISLALVGVLFLALAVPAVAGGRGGHGGFHRGHGGFHHRCCFGPAFVGGLFVGATVASPWWWGYPYSYYSGYGAYPAMQYADAPVYQAPAVQREVCYSNGCYRLYGDGVTTAYQWMW